MEREARKMSEQWQAFNQQTFANPRHQNARPGGGQGQGQPFRVEFERAPPPPKKSPGPVPHRHSIKEAPPVCMESLDILQQWTSRFVSDSPIGQLYTYDHQHARNQAFPASTYVQQGQKQNSNKDEKKDQQHPWMKYPKDIPIPQTEAMLEAQRAVQEQTDDHDHVAKKQPLKQHPAHVFHDRDAAWQAADSTLQQVEFLMRGLAHALPKTLTWKEVQRNMLQKTDNDRDKSEKSDDEEEKLDLRVLEEMPFTKSPQECWTILQQMKALVERMEQEGHAYMMLRADRMMELHQRALAAREHGLVDDGEDAVLQDLLVGKEGHVDPKELLLLGAPGIEGGGKDSSGSPNQMGTDANSNNNKNNNDEDNDQDFIDADDDPEIKGTGKINVADITDKDIEKMEEGMDGQGQQDRMKLHEVLSNSGFGTNNTTSNSNNENNDNTDSQSSSSSSEDESDSESEDNLDEELYDDPTAEDHVSRQNRPLHIRQRWEDGMLARGSPTKGRDADLHYEYYTQFATPGVTVDMYNILLDAMAVCASHLSLKAQHERYDNEETEPLAKIHRMLSPRRVDVLLEKVSERHVLDGNDLGNNNPHTITNLICFNAPLRAIASLPYSYPMTDYDDNVLSRRARDDALIVTFTTLDQLTHSQHVGWSSATMAYVLRVVNKYFPSGTDIRGNVSLAIFHHAQEAGLVDDFVLREFRACHQPSNTAHHDEWMKANNLDDPNKMPSHKVPRDWKLHRRQRRWHVEDETY